MTRGRGNYGWAADRTATHLHAGRGEAAWVGQDLVHTGVDRDRAIAQISTDFSVLVSELSAWLTANQNHAAANSVASWIAADVTPTVADWAEFVAREKKSWWTKLATSWDTFEAWAERIKQFRSLARAHGVTLQSAEPASLPKTIWQRTEDGHGSEGMAVLGVLKIGALAALGVMGAAGLYTAIRNLGSKASAPDPKMLRQIVREELSSAKRKA